MRGVLLIASALSLLSVAARADGFDFRDLYGKAKSFAESVLTAPQPRRDDARVPAAEIDPKMALVPREEGRMRVIAPPGTPGGDRKIDPR